MEKEYCFPQICNFDCPTFKEGNCYPSIASAVIDKSINYESKSEIEEAAQQYDVDLKYWLVTFAYTSKYKDRYAKIWGTRKSVENEAYERFGEKVVVKPFSSARKEIRLYKLKELMFAELDKND